MNRRLVHHEGRLSPCEWRCSSSKQIIPIGGREQGAFYKKTTTSYDRSPSNTIYTFPLLLCMQYLLYPNLLHNTQDTQL